MMEQIRENIGVIREKIRAAAAAAGRDEKDIILVGASKMNDSAACRAAIAAGIDALGENRVQEMTQKLGEGAYEGAPLHFIGHLQRNKVRQVVGKVELIHSVGSIALLNEIDAQAQKLGIRQDILLEVNVGAEDSKSGFAPEEVVPLVQKFSGFPNIRLRGLMAIPPICEKPGANDKFFQEMCNLSVDITAKKDDNVCVDILSMGMSGDFEDAVRCGSTMIRLGTAIFGPRDYTKSHQA